MIKIQDKYIVQNKSPGWGYKVTPGYICYLKRFCQFKIVLYQFLEKVHLKMFLANDVINPCKQVCIFLAMLSFGFRILSLMHDGA